MVVHKIVNFLCNINVLQAGFKYPAKSGFLKTNTQVDSGLTAVPMSNRKLLLKKIYLRARNLKLRAFL